MTLIPGGAGAAARRGTDKAAKEALVDWYGHSGACWTCNTPGGARCDTGAEIHARFMAACSAARAPARAPAPAGQLADEVPLW